MRVLLLTLTLLCGSAGALDGIVLVRHAEKEDGWPSGRELDPLHPLSAEGMARADRLAELLAGENLVAVFASPTTRSLHTGLPTARAHGLEPEVAAASVRRDEMEGFLTSLIERFPGEGRVLIVGHSNTVPLLLRALGADESCDDALGIVAEDYGPGIRGYDGLWRVDLSRNGCAAMSRIEQPGAP